MYRRQREEGNELNINQYPPDTALTDTYLKQICINQNPNTEHASNMRNASFSKRRKEFFQVKNLLSEGQESALHHAHSPPHHQEYPHGHLQLPQDANGRQTGDLLQSRDKTAILSFICSKQGNSLAISLTLASWGRLSCSALYWYGLTSSHSFGKHNIRRIERTEIMSKEGLQR